MMKADLAMLWILYAFVMLMAFGSALGMVNHK
jgi:hypothetical protein